VFAFFISGTYISISPLLFLLQSTKRVNATHIGDFNINIVDVEGDPRLNTSAYVSPFLCFNQTPLTPAEAVLNI
jgi:hypothetical protein